MVKDETLPSRVDLSGAQRALLEERLQRARQATARAPDSRPSIPRRTSDADLPLSFAQERLWFLDQLDPGNAVYNVCQAVRLKGALDLEALGQAFNAIVQRHEILRTNFVAAEGRAIQSIAPTRTLEVQWVDLAGAGGERDRAAIERELQKRLREEARRPFDFVRDMLMRALVVRVAPREHVLLIAMHHIISDGWSMGILFRELATLYTATCTGTTAALPDLPLQFADYVLWDRQQLQGPALEKSLAYWREQLGGTLPVLELPTDRPRAQVRTTRGAVQTMTLPPRVAHGIKALGQQEGTTLFMTLLAAFEVLLHRWTGQDDIAIGSVVAGRRKVELERLIGFFVNTLVFRSDLSGEPTFRELLARVRERALGALAHQDLPFDRLVQELRPDRTLSRNPLFQVMFVLQNAPMAPTELPQLEMEPIDVETSTAKFDLMLTMMETPAGLRAAFEYHADLFEAETIARLMRCFETLLAGIVADPGERISRLPLLSEAEREQVLVRFNATTAEYPRHATIPELFAEQVARAPQAIAVQLRNRRITYRELDEESSALAARLRGAGVAPDVLVGVCLERSIEAIVALLGIVKAGGAYVSLDPAYPKERLAFMLADTKTPVLLTQRSLAEKLPEHGARTIWLEPGATLRERGGETEAAAAESTRAAAGPENLAYVSYTSGSTGRPKGVCIPHRAVVRLVKNASFARLGPDEVFLQFAPIAFDASTLEIWGPLLNGGRLVIFPPGRASLAEIGEVIEQSGVTTLWLTAGLFHQMVEEQIDSLRNVRQLLAGGDVLSPTHVARALERLPRTQLINGYGPTENTTFTCCHPISAAPEPGRSVPIGRPIANTHAYILDAHRQPVPIGVPGELYAGGDGLARGYLGHPELTAEKFVHNPFAGPDGRLYRTGDLARWLPDGTIEFLGRVDRQVKIRGFRVEPAEVEAVLGAHPAVKECAVVVRDDAAETKYLVAYVAPKQRPEPPVEAWRDYLADKLPEYLVPSAFVCLDALPLNPNGKVDVAALPAPGARRDDARELVAPRDETERKLAEIWTAVLGAKSVGIRDRFFDLGGHSLLAVRLVARIEKELGKKVPVAAVFQQGTIEQLARLVRGNAEPYAAATSVVEIQGRGERPPVFFVHGVGGGMFWGYANLARHVGPHQPIHAFKSRGLDGLPEWPTIEEMAAHYLADLRAHRPKGPYLLGGYCFGGVVAYEMARQLEAQGESVALLALINCSPPNSNYVTPRERGTLAWRLKFLRNLIYLGGCFLFRWTMRERWEFVRWKLCVLRKNATSSMAQDATERALAGLDELLSMADYSEKQRDLWQSHVRALRAYRPKPYNGAVTLFRTRGHGLFTSFADDYGWGEVVRGSVTMLGMPGGHANILDEPHVRAVADAFEVCVRDALAPKGGAA